MFMFYKASAKARRGHARGQAQRKGQQHGTVRGAQGGAGLEDGESWGHRPPHAELVPTGPAPRRHCSPLLGNNRSLSPLTLV